MKHITWISLILGLWLIVSPYALAYETTSPIAASNSVVVGLLFVICSIWTLVGTSALAGVGAFQALASLWLILSPYALQYHTIQNAMVNDVIIGIVVLIVSLTEEWSLGHQAPARA